MILSRINFIITLSLILISSSFAVHLRILSERKIMEKHTKRQHITSKLPYKKYEGRFEKNLPPKFSWLNFGGENYLTKSMNQHLPTYCGSCWAVSAVTVLADRIKIIRMSFLRDEYEEESEDALSPDINLSVQFILNCGGEVAGSCHGGSATGAFQFIKDTGYIPFETCQPYMACSSDSKEDLCQHIDTQCKPINICKTCTRNLSGDGVCNKVSKFPYATVDEYGVYKLKDAKSMEEHILAVKAELVTRGPVTAAVAGHHLRNYTGGIIYDDESLRDIHTTHEVSIIGWDVEYKTGVEYWIIRNSWGEFWGEMSFFRLELGKNLLGIEEEISWATIGFFTKKNEPCYENGTNCNLASMNFIPGISKFQ